MARPWATTTGTYETPTDWCAVRRASEVEAYYVRSDDGALVDGLEGPIHQAVQKGLGVYGEFAAYMVEIAPPDTEVWRSPADARLGIYKMYQALNRSAPEGFMLTTIADKDCWGGKVVGGSADRKGDRYQWLSRYGLPSARVGATMCGFQTHICNPSKMDDKYFLARALAEQMMALVLGASANSYSCDGLVHSLRYLHFICLPSVGPFGWRSRQDYDDFVSMEQDDGSIQGPHDLHPWVKPCKDTMEARVADTPGSVLEAWALHAVMHTIMVYCFQQVECGNQELVFMDESGQVQRNLRALDRVACHGLSDMDLRVHSPFERRATVALGELYRVLEQRIGDLMNHLGYGWERRYFFRDIVEKQDNGAMRQMKWWADGCISSEVLRRDNQHLRFSMHEAHELLVKMDGVMFNEETA